MIRFDHVSKTYPGGTRAVEDFSLTVEQGSTTVFLGTSGCGKTTLMRMVNAMVTPTSGRVFVRDQDVAGEDPVRLRRSIGYVLQEGGLFPHRSIADNIATVPRLEGATKQASRERALELLELVGLDREMADRYPAQLSGGQRQRVGVARALANRADILLMDEPFGALDPIVRTELQCELKEIQRVLGTTILFVTHDVDEAFTLGDQVAVLSTGGHIEQVGTPTELLSSPASPFVAEFVGASRAAIARVMTGESALIHLVGACGGVLVAAALLPLVAGAPVGGASSVARALPFACVAIVVVVAAGVVGTRLALRRVSAIPQGQKLVPA